ncbi:uncharacterized protein LOC128326509 isoform X2 [Hemicordylus capensis]|nr:uncharacterized protein LOC128326509 isoform X2 [Hemicordylus capensis]XP_053109427.1 uncharacterized protein LOC128326509 isoform X2 [Hemicordylus capensis]
MDKDFTPSPHRIQRCIPTLGTSSNPSRIPGLSSRSLGAGGLAAFSPILKKDTCLNSFMQDSTRQIPLAKGRGLSRLNSRLGPPKPPRSHELSTSYPLPTTSQFPQWTATNGVTPRKLSSLSFTFRQGSSASPPGQQLLLHSMAKREFQKVHLRKEALGRGGALPVPGPQPLSGLQTSHIVQSCTHAQTTTLNHESEDHISETEMPDSQRSLTPADPPPSFPQPHPQTIGKDPTNSSLKAAVKEDISSNDRSGIPKDIYTLQDLDGSGKILLPLPQEYLERQDAMGSLFMADSMMSPVTNATGFECKSRRDHLPVCVCVCACVCVGGFLF